jgi:hypothetical protein
MVLNTDDGRMCRRHAAPYIAAAKAATETAPSTTTPAEEKPAAAKRGRKKAVPAAAAAAAKPDASILPDVRKAIELTSGGSYLELEKYDEERGLYKHVDSQLIIHQHGGNKLLAVAELDENDKPQPISSKNETVALTFGLGNFGDFFDDSSSGRSSAEDRKSGGGSSKQSTPPKVESGPNIVSADVENGMVAINNMSGVAKAIEANKTKAAAASNRRRGRANA